MEEFLLFNELYDCYSMLLTENEKLVFNDYYLEDLSMQEIADNLKITKSAVGKTLKIVEKKLDNYENTLHLYQNKQKINKLLENNIDSSLLQEINELI